jgi:hypothetical protein
MSSNSNDAVRSLNHLKSLLQKGRVVPVIGTGFSVSASGNDPCASWGGLLRNGIAYAKRELRNVEDSFAHKIEEILATGTATALTKAAGEIESLLGGAKAPAFRDWLKDSVGKLAVRSSGFFDPLAKLGPLYLTTNYDGLLEAGLGGPALTWLDRDRVQQVVLGDNYGIIHVHGYWECPESLVLGPESYEAVTNDPFTQAMLRHLVFGKSLLFIGFGAGLQDRNFSQLRDWMRQWTEHSCYAHFRLVRASELETVRTTHADDSRIIPLVYGDNHSELPYFLSSLTKSLPSTAAKKVRWRQLEDFRFALLSNSQAQWDFFVRELALAALHAIGPTTRVQFSVLYKFSLENRSGQDFPVVDLFCHRVAYLACLRERVTKFIEALLMIRQNSGTRAEAERVSIERMKQDAAVAADWSFQSDIEPTPTFRTFTLTVDPAQKRVSIRTDPNASLNILDYAEKGKTTSDALRFIAACLNQGPFAIMENVFEGVGESPGLIDILVDYLDKVGIDLNAVRINSENEEEWAYVNLRLKTETGELLSTYQ